MPDRRTIADMLCEVGPLLYGEAWEHPMARALHVSPRTVQRWESGYSIPPDGIAVELRTLVEQRLIALRRLADEMPKASPITS
jgi:hypothetical protein